MAGDDLTIEEQATARTIKKLKTQREVIKGAIAAFTQFLTKYKTSERPSTRNLQQRYDNLIKIYETLEQIQSELEMLDETQVSERFIIQDNYFDVKAEAEDLLNPVSSNNSVAQNSEQPLNTTSQIVNNGQQNTPLAHDNAVRDRRRLFNDDIDQHSHMSETSDFNEVRDPRPRRRRTKLPDAKLPSFDGHYEEWLSFKDHFLTMIHDDEELTNFEKLQYLKTCVTGKAAEKIKTLQMIGDNYARAWDLLTRAYDNRRLMISRYASLIIKLPIQERETAEGLRKLADETQQYLESLSSLGVATSEEIIVTLLEEKLHKDTLDRWEETIEHGVFPKLKDLIQFLLNRAARLSRHENKLIEKSIASEVKPHKHNSKANRKKTNKAGHTFVTDTNENRCLVCSGNKHPVFRCPKFKKYSVQERIEVVKRTGICSSCLNKHENNEECKFSKCLKCDEKHNVLLHTEA